MAAKIARDTDVENCAKRLKDERTEEKKLIELDDGAFRDGRLAAINLSYVQFIKIKEKVQLMKSSEPQEIQAIYDCLAFRIKYRIEVQRSSDGEGMEGLYNISIAEEQFTGKLEKISQNHRNQYLESWFRGFKNVVDQLPDVL